MYVMGIPFILLDQFLEYLVGGATLSKKGSLGLGGTQ